MPPPGRGKGSRAKSAEAIAGHGAFAKLRRTARRGCRARSPSWIIFLRASGADDSPYPRVNEIRAVAHTQGECHARFAILVSGGGMCRVTFSFRLPRQRQESAHARR